MEPLPQPVLPAIVLQAHEAAVAAGQDSYIDPRTGYLVWTRLYLEKRGSCCHSGCRHCPYELYP